MPSAVDAMQTYNPSTEHTCRNNERQAAFDDALLDTCEWSVSLASATVPEPGTAWSVLWRFAGGETWAETGRHDSSFYFRFPAEEVPNPRAGYAVFFRIDPQVEHRVTALTAGTKTAFAGWFSEASSLLDRLHARAGSR